MARSKLEVISAEDAKKGDLVHFTAAGVAYLVVENDGHRLTARRVTQEHQATVILPYTQMTMVVRETPAFKVG